MTHTILSASESFGNGIEGHLENKVTKGQKKPLSFLTAQGMIKRFLTCSRVITVEVNCKRFTIQELAEELVVDPSELELFTKPASKDFHRRVSEKITLPLIKLYCNTKWVKSSRDRIKLDM